MSPVIEKLKQMDSETLLATWEAHWDNQASFDPMVAPQEKSQMYNKELTMDDWMELVYSELTVRRISVV